MDHNAAATITKTTAMAHQQSGASTSNDTKDAVQNSGRLIMDATKGSRRLDPSPLVEEVPPAEPLNSSNSHTSSIRDDISTNCDAMLGLLAASHPPPNCPTPETSHLPSEPVTALDPSQVTPVEGIGDRPPVCDIEIFADGADGSLIDFAKLAAEDVNTLADLFFGENDGGPLEGELPFSSRESSDDQALPDDIRA
jgi:hypothetical protein